MNNQEILVMLNQKSREVSVALGNLCRYELAVERGQQQQNQAYYDALKQEVRDAQAALHIIRAAIDGKYANELTAEEIQAVRRVAQEEAIGAIAAASGWEWQAEHERWQTPGGVFYSSTGEVLNA